MNAAMPVAVKAPRLRFTVVGLDVLAVHVARVQLDHLLGRAKHIAAFAVGALISWIAHAAPPFFALMAASAH